MRPVVFSLYVILHTAREWSMIHYSREHASTASGSSGFTPLQPTLGIVHSDVMLFCSYLAVKIFSPLKMYWNWKTNSFVYSLNLRSKDENEIYIDDKDEYETNRISFTNIYSKMC